MPVTVNDNALRRAQLQKAVLLYGFDANHCTYATVHDIDIPETGQPVIRAGRPIDRKSLMEFSHTLSKNGRRAVGVLPPNVLSVGAEFLVWWIPPSERSIFFKVDSQDTNKVAIGQRSGVVPQPGLIFAVKDRSLFVVAVKGKNRPTAETPIFQSPYFNVWENTKVCTGNAKKPEAAVAEQMAAWEKSFFHSNFTHPNVSKLVNYPKGAFSLWSDLLDGKFKKFPERALLPLQSAKRGRNGWRTEAAHPLTVADWVAQFEDNNNG